MGGGSGYAYRVQLPEGSMMAEVFVADILASMEGLTLGASVQAKAPAVPPPPKRNPPGPPAKASARRFLPIEEEGEDSQPPLQKARGATDTHAVCTWRSATARLQR